VTPSPVEADLRACLDAQAWDDVVRAVEQHWAVLTQTNQALLVEAVNALPAEVLRENPRLVAAKTYVNYLPVNGAVRPLRFQHAVAPASGNLLDRLADLTSRSVTARFQGNLDRAISLVREAHEIIADVSDDEIASIRPVLPDIRLQWAISLELGGELPDATRAYERTFDEALTFDNHRIAVKAAGTLALNYVLAGNRTVAEQWLARQPVLPTDGATGSSQVDTVLTTGELARALTAAHDLRFDDAQAALDAAPSADVDRETWAMRLFSESVLARASGRARQQLSHLGATLATQPDRTRTAGLNGWLVTMAMAELQLAIGDVEAATRTVGRLRVFDLPAANDPVRVLRAWATLRRGNAQGAIVLAAPGLAEPLSSPRITAELLAVVAAANLELGLPDDARTHFEAALDIIDSERLPIVLLRFSSAERALLLEDLAALPRHVQRELAVQEGAADTPRAVPLSDRERVVLRRLMSGATLDAIAAAEHVSRNTIKTQVTSIYRKLGAANRDDAIRIAAASPYHLA
jgi:DNA-binding CsgD family transcriptional regulator